MTYLGACFKCFQVIMSVIHFILEKNRRMASYGGGSQNWHGRNDPPWRGSRGKRRGFRGKNPYRWHPDNQTPQGEHKNVSNIAFYQLLFMSLVPKF